MRKRAIRALFATVLLSTCLALSGCESFDSIKETVTGFDFGGFVNAVKESFDDFMNPVSYEEGRQAQMERITPTVTSPTLVKDGYLTVGIKNYDVIAPSYIENSDGTISGLDIDYASALAEEMGLKVRFVPVNNVGEALYTTCDIVMDVAAGEDAYTTVVGAYEEQATAFFHKGEPITLSSANLTGKTVAVQQGSVSQALLETAGINMVQTPYANLNDAFSALDAGQVDFVLCDAYPGAYLASTFEGINFAGTLDVPTSIGIGVSLYKSELQSAVQAAYDKINSNGIKDIIRRDWVGGMTNLSYANQVQLSTQ